VKDLARIDFVGGFGQTGEREKRKEVGRSEVTKKISVGYYLDR
jgi:hypothetical protein